MELDVSRAFLTPGTPFPFEAKVALPPQSVNGEQVSFDEVALDGSFFAADDLVRIEGELHTVAHGACAMCMEPADAKVTVRFDETFRKDANELQDESFLYAGKSLPLDHMTLTLVMLNLPMRFLCKEGCKGSREWQAWQNENPTSSCEDGSPTQRPFEALQSLLKKDEEV